MRNGSHFAAHVPNQVLAVIESGSSPRQLFHIAPHQRQVHRSPAPPMLPHAVVQFSGNSSALVILQLHEARREFPQIPIHSVKIRGAFLNSQLKLRLRLEQQFVMPTAIFPHPHDDTGTKHKCQKAE